MSYQVLARKWRPKNFSQLMGQEHVVTILANALSQNRLHHAYLFTGTRGVGKTTIARIFAKSLNCVEGITATPCGQCDVCQDIDRGNFVDLLEIDAASRTKVDDTREILENVQYAPSRGRFKVYLIDEVHMLSRSSFNALLKTLEEPPEHVKFILATTDPQKLPITVLSRCLQFHLKALTIAQIETKLIEILNAEKVTFEASAITILAKAARGSMRDSLSLTDQAIAQGQGDIQLPNVQQMLGGIDQNWPFKILISLIKQDTNQLMELSQEIASYSPNYSRLFAELIQLLHQVAMYQVVAHDFNLSNEHAELLQKFAQAMSPEDVQLYYQIALNGRKDLPYAGDEQAAFDMALLRLLAFKPLTNPNALPKQAVEQSAGNANVVSFDDNMLDKTQVTRAQVQEEESTDLTTSMQHHEAPVVIVDDIEEESGEAYIEQQLATEMLAIEQDAENLKAQEVTHNIPQADIHTADSMLDTLEQTHTDEPSSASLQDELEQDRFDAQDEKAPVEQATSDDIGVPSDILQQVNSPISEVIKGRNLLRSRKKQQEGSAKKSEDADKRQPTAAELQQKANLHDIPNIETVPEQPFTPEVIDPSKIKKANQIDRWANMIDAMALNGRLRQLAIQATIDPSSNDDKLILCLNQKTKHLKTENAHQQLIDFVSHYFNKAMDVEINIVEQTVDDPYQIQSHINDKRYEYAKQVLLEDETVIQMREVFQAELDESTVIAK
jgi:DNA polymerase III subunit gamma/tau